MTPARLALLRRLGEALNRPWAWVVYHARNMTDDELGRHIVELETLRRSQEEGEA